MGVNRNRISVGFNAVDVNGIHKRAEESRADNMSASQAGHRFVFVGQLIARKGVDVVIEAFAALGLEESTLNIVGVGELEPSLRAQVTSLGLEHRVHFLGYVDNDQVPVILADMHTLVMPSREEVWGLVANEALASGLHVVVSRTAGVAASIESMSGVVLVNSTVENVRDGMLEAVESWSGYIQTPEILAKTPDLFASVFRNALSGKAQCEGAILS